MLGSPEAGKSMLARRLTTLLPAMTLAAALATTRLHRGAGRTGARTAVVTTRPCRAPHHTISDAGLIGGGQVRMPGEVSRAHHGVLFFDELPESRRHVLEMLRQPLEKGITTNNPPHILNPAGLSALAEPCNRAMGSRKKFANRNLSPATHHHDMTPLNRNLL
jgi:MoxR-like ATPase